MSKSCCFAFVLAVICLSLEADAQPTVDETMTCGSSTSNDVEHLFKIIASNQRDISDEIKDVKQVLASDSEETNETRLEDVVKEVKDVKKLLARCDAAVSTELVSALVCEYRGYIDNWTEREFNATTVPRSLNINTLAISYRSLVIM